ncbi:hypothetical protein AK812_SmicGene22693 [Symbiodinium microadriaticum]|uniref:Uncharacterized protein n=1 Tax=Symbiodinium microadriaticum TaxID=2951 RepID=A0A1Q9DJ78_SYMMI|nr:hypothetical protein AK812_SmicGene22693 [Symbiodinium microadriaticum]
MDKMMRACDIRPPPGLAHSSPARVARNKWRVLKLRVRKAVSRALARSSAPEVIPRVSRDSAGGLTTLRDSDGETQPAAAAYGTFLSQLLKTSSLALARSFRTLSETGERKAWPPGLACNPENEDAHLVTANLCLTALNHLEQGMPKSGLSSGASLGPSESQKSDQTHVCGRVHLLLSRLQEGLAGAFCWHGAFSKLEARERSAVAVPLLGDSVDLPVRAATCDPENLVPAELWSKVSAPGAIFGSQLTCTQTPAASSNSQDRREYLVLTGRELRCGKLRLRSEVRGVAKVFAVPKSDRTRQRKIWDGSHLSEIASKPPKPERLANPSSFLDIFVRPGEQLYMSKRDASTYFDLLAAPPDLQAWFGQEPVTVQELSAAAGMDIEEVYSFVDDLNGQKALGPDSVLFPVNTAWPMGFSWSSCVAQESTLGMLRCAGVNEQNVLSLDHRLPESQQELCAVATDDVILFHRCKRQGISTLRRLDASFALHGIQRNEKKDVTLASSLTGLGCDISASPPMVQPASGKQARLVLATCDLLVSERGMFSIFSQVYDFVREQPESEKQRVPASVLDELFVSLALAPLLPASLDREFLPEVLACDAAPEFGFGVTLAQCGKHLAEKVGRLSERRGDYVRLEHSAEDPPEVERMGTLHRLPLKKTDFKQLISCKARWAGGITTVLSS